MKKGQSLNGCGGYLATALVFEWTGIARTQSFFPILRFGNLGISGIENRLGAMVCSLAFSKKTHVCFLTTDNNNVRFS